MGTVYQAFDVTLRRRAALKVLGPDLVANAEALQRFMSEARTASSLNHPNVVTIYEFGELPPSGRFMAMELVEGETLRAILERGRPARSRLLEWIAQIADGIAVAHAAGIVHRDLKPENVVITTGGGVKILDFGLAKLREGVAPREAGPRVSTMVRTTPGMVVGTIGYMSPEQARGLPVDHRTDLFALGCILYESLTGREPFPGDTALDVMHAILYSEPAPVDDPELQRIVRKCLAKDPEQRYQSARELAADVRALLHAPAPAPAARNRTPLLLGLAAAAVAIAAAVAVVRTTRERPPMSITRITSSGNVIGAAISPDGEYALYVLSEAGMHSVWIRQLATGSGIQIVPPSPTLELSGGRFAPDGRSIYYISAGTLYQVPVLGGVPRKLLSNATGSLTFSPDGRRIAFLRRGALVMANADGRGERTLLSGAVATYFTVGPAWSPDGESIATALRTADGIRVVAVDVENGTTRTLLDGVAMITSLAWLRDGEGIVATLYEHTSSTGQLWLIDPEGGAHRRITTDLFDYRTVTATADGKKLLAVAADTLSRIWRAGPDGRATPVNSSRSDGSGGVAIANDGSVIHTSVESGKWRIWRGRQQLTGDEGAIAPVLSRDGRTIVFTLLRARGALLARMNADGSGLRVLSPLILTRSLSQVASITPDGRWVVFGSDGWLWKVSIDGGKPVRLADFEADSPAVSPDGTRVAFHLQNALGVMPIGGGPVQRFANITRTRHSSVRWTADGTALLHNAGLNDRSNIWLQPLDGSPPRKITQFDDEYVLHFDVSPDGRHMAIVRGTLSRDAVLIENFR
jgi:eukaryotic-like serine/threonine-protein kinase